MTDSSHSILESLDIKLFPSIEAARNFDEKRIQEYHSSPEYSMDQKTMQALYRENERLAIENPKDSFWTHYFLSPKEINKNMLALGPNLREWSKVAKKNDAEIFMVVDEETLPILKNQSLPADSGMNGNYFDFFKDCGYKFVKTTDLINKLPEETSKIITKKNDDINHLIDKGYLSMASKRDFADVLVTLSGNKFVKNIESDDNRDGAIYSFEPDIIANSQTAEIIAGTFPMSIKKMNVLAIFFPSDKAGIMKLIEAKTTHGEEAEIQIRNLNKKFCNDGSGNNVQPSVEVWGRRGDSIYVYKALRDAFELISKIKEYSDNNPEAIIDSNTRAILTREVSLKLKQNMLLTTEDHAESNVQASKLGPAGSISLRSWWENLGKDFFTLITKKSEILDFMKHMHIKTSGPTSTKELTWNETKSFITRMQNKNKDELPTANPSKTNETIGQGTSDLVKSLRKNSTLAAATLLSNITPPLSSNSSLSKPNPRSSLWSLPNNKLNPPSTTLTPSKPLNHQLSQMNLGADRK
jgi:hypothetical protein